MACLQCQTSSEKFRKDYAPLSHRIREVELLVQIHKGKTTTSSKLHIEQRAGSTADDLILDSENMLVKRIAVGSNDLAEGDGYKKEGDQLIVFGASLPETDSFDIEITVETVPEENTELSGLYFSGCMYCTQMEAEGFRRFSPFQDRPDIMAKYTKVRIEADAEQCPILLSNGNLLEQGSLPEGRHFAVWSDPFPKPSYLFALVAGQLGSIKDSFVTQSGRKVAIEIFSEPENVDKLQHAMESVKKAMIWDETRFGREYDLDNFKVVAVNDFNMGAMENKGLNVFNTALLLADPKTATDADYERIEGVVGHEYFHNWSGNRVTCRDWFQLTLKEGLTVYRDQEFSSDVGSRAVKRIEDVMVLRSHQFSEDCGPMAHPIRPESYIAMDNFYTGTVYLKGAEVIRMYDTLFGIDGFRKGMDLYWARHDGSAVTCDDFRAAMSDANEKDLTQFEQWYIQAGTPEIIAEGDWDAGAKKYTLSMSQKTPDTPGQTDKGPLHIPIRVGFLDRGTGKELVPNTILELTQKEQSFVIAVEDAEEAPVASLLRGFSAPVKLTFPHTNEELSILASKDTDSFNRWNAMQMLGTRVVLEALASEDIDAYQPPSYFIDAMKEVLQDTKTTDLSLLAYALSLPPESTLMPQAPTPVDPVNLHRARSRVRTAVAMELRPLFKERMDGLKAPKGQELKIDVEGIGRRRLFNTCLGYYAIEKDDLAVEEVANHYKAAQGMTDKVAALGLLLSMPDKPESLHCLQDFYDSAEGNALVLNKWFTLQAIADVDDLLSRVEKLVQHPDFAGTKNPNRLRSLIGAFASGWQFHQSDGLGYKFHADRVLDVDKFNPQMSSGLARSFSTWRLLDEARQHLILAELKRLQQQELSKNLMEVVTKLIG
eukprot:gnl/MRDRNA2_/MRDRNA2_85499_c0_seq1.p1 gnl/MRDRNA2_/MRDRNA2_85499_c0~~gnl/MRDRNA2_/MRDRNA2_85499_c0_seq1.p1  ORF type:complete len:883 (-),score=191.36 gnl/MRDRNA2_/MRDRNA2_85499_c0_seq1:1026-3674(-)